jgi:hypothetical protein
MLRTARSRLQGLTSSRALRFGAKLAAWAGLALGGLLLATLLSGKAILNGYGRSRLQRTFAAAHPGCQLRLGPLRYALGGNRLEAESVTVTAAAATFQAGRVSLSGVRWGRLLFRTRPLAESLAEASLQASGLELRLPRDDYGLRCASLSGSVASGDLLAVAAELYPLVADEPFFAASRYRRTRFHLRIPRCQVAGLGYADLFQGLACRARSIAVSDPTFDALASRWKPLPPLVHPPLMVNEALAGIGMPLTIDRISLTGGHVAYGERTVAGTRPGVLVFTAVQLAAQDIGNQGAAAIALQLQGRLMGAGLLQADLSLPVAPGPLALRCSGTLGGMELTRLNGFLEGAERIRIRSGKLRFLAFDLHVQAGQARGQVRASFRDFRLSLQDQQTGKEKGLGKRIASFVANRFKLRQDNGPDLPGGARVGTVAYRRKPEDSFIQVLWFSLRSGVLDVIKR